MFLFQKQKRIGQPSGANLEFLPACRVLLALGPTGAYGRLFGSLPKQIAESLVALGDGGEKSHSLAPRLVQGWNDSRTNAGGNAPQLVLEFHQFRQVSKIALGIQSVRPSGQFDDNIQLTVEESQFALSPASWVLTRVSVMASQSIAAGVGAPDLPFPRYAPLALLSKLSA